MTEIRKISKDWSPMKVHLFRSPPLPPPGFASVPLLRSIWQASSRLPAITQTEVVPSPASTSWALDNSTNCQHTGKMIYDIGIKHDFPFINIRKVPREEPEVFNISQGTLRMLMNDKIMFDRYYCINSRKHTKNWENVCALYSSALPLFSYSRTLFVNILDSDRGQVHVLFLMMIWRLSTRFAWRPRECINIIQ